MNRVLRVHRDLLDVRRDAIDPAAVLLEKVPRALERTGQTIQRRTNFVLVTSHRRRRDVQQLVGLRDEQIESRRIDPAHDRAVRKRRTITTSRIDRQILLAQKARARHEKHGVVVNRLLVLLLQLDLHPHQRGARSRRSFLPTAKLDLGHFADLHAGNLHRRTRLQSARVVEVHEHRVLRLEVDPTHDEDEHCEKYSRRQDQNSDFDFDRTRTRHDRNMPQKRIRSHAAVTTHCADNS